MAMERYTVSEPSVFPLGFFSSARAKGFVAPG